MKLGIIHPSDCHIDDCNEPFLGRVKAIAQAVKVVKKADAWLILFSGDISQAGHDAQVQCGSAFLKELQSSVTEITGTQTILVAIPGNHDCCIPDEAQRRVLTDEIRAGKTTEKETLLRAQAAFWRTFPIPEVPNFNSRMAFLQQVEVSGESIAVIGVNSSWMSNLHERQGGLVFQPEWFDPIAAWIYQNEPDLVVLSIHHPIHWQNEILTKQLWHKLARVTDILLTGHEHVPDGFMRSSGPSSISVFEGGVLSQRSDRYEHCNFQILFLDTSRNELDRVVCNWDSTRDEFKVEKQPQQQFRKNMARVRNALREEWLKELEASMLEACHLRKNPVKLSEYYVWPVMRLVDKTKPNEPRVRTNEEFLGLLSEKKFLRITGTAKAGKTSLLKQLVPSLKQEGYTPIFVDAAHFETSSKAISDALSLQYVDLSVETLHTAKQIILLIDNWEHLRLRLEKRLEFIEELLQRCAYCILATSVSMDVEYLSYGRASILDAFQDLKMEALTRTKRSDLLLRWASIAAPLDLEVETLEREVEQGNDKISIILGENLVPASPIVTVMLWQELQSGVASTQGVGSNGHLYKHLIEYSLKHSAIKATDIGWDQRYSFLGFIAISIFKKKAILTRTDLQRVKDAFVKEVCLQSDLDAIIRDCCNIGILREKDDAVYFGFEFGLYYFTAYYIHEHREMEANLIKEMIHNLYAFDNMQTIIFYLYLSSDASVMNEILQLAESFETLSQEFDFTQIPAASTTLTNAVRPERLAKCVEDRPSFDAIVATSRNHDTDVRKIVLARRLSFVLGQVVSNFPAKVASRIGAERRDSFLKEAYRLELVALGNSLKLLTAHAYEFLEHLRSHISYETGTAQAKHEQDNRLQRIIPALLHFMVVQSVLEVPARLCSKDLMSVHDTIAEANGPRNRVYMVINTAIRIDQGSSYPTNLVLARAQECAKAKDGSWDILRDVVYFSMLKCKRNYRVRQQMCAEFRLGDSAQMLLEEG